MVYPFCVALLLPIYDRQSKKRAQTRKERRSSKKAIQKKRANVHICRIINILGLSTLQAFKPQSSVCQYLTSVYCLFHRLGPSLQVHLYSARLSPSLQVHLISLPTHNHHITDWETRSALQALLRGFRFPSGTKHYRLGNQKCSTELTKPYSSPIGL